MKKEHTKALVDVAFRIDEKVRVVQQRKENIKRMAHLARSGKRSSQEFKELDHEFRNPTEISFDNELNELQMIVQKIRKGPA